MKKGKRNNNYSHGHSLNRKVTPELRTYYKAKERCNNPNYKQYLNYGGRGIKFLYASFNEFLNDVGDRPSDKHSIDRIDNNGHYQKGNCKWSTSKEQSRNRKSTYLYNGETAKDASIRLGGCTRTVDARIRLYGWSLERAFTTPVRKSK